MSCPQCGSAVAAASKFCSECGAAQPRSSTLIDPSVTGAVQESRETPEPVVAPGTRAAAETSIAVEERQAIASFTSAIVPVLRAPVVVVTLLATLLALAMSLIASTGVYTLVNLIAGEELPGAAGDWWDFAWVAHFQSHQVPLTNDDTVIAIGPILFIAIAIASCWAGVQLARGIYRATPLAQSATPMTERLGVWAFAGTYAIANLILGAFGPDDTGIHVILGILFSIAIAAGGYVLAGRYDLLDRDARTPAPTSERTPDRPTWRRFAIPTLVLAGMIAIASTATLVANVIESTTDDDIDTRPRVTFDAVHLVDQGWTTVAYGLLGATQARVDDGDDIESRDSRIWDLRDDDVIDTAGSNLQVGTLAAGGLNVASFIIVLIAGFGTVLLGGLYAGFRVARDTARTSDMRTAALSGAVVGPVWALLTIVLSLIVTDRTSLDAGSIEASFTTVAGIEIFFLALVGGTILGAVGGLLAANAAATSTTPTAAATSLADPDGPVPA